MINVSICVSDIPKEQIKTGTNGKKYLNIVVDERKSPDNYGNTHSVTISQSKEEREAKTPKVYVGNGKEFLFNNQQKAVKPDPNVTQLPDDDLPF